jgi:hypothetical protein
MSYVSRASGGGLAESVLTSLAMQAQETNVTLDVTGVLFAFDGRFLQILEGDRAALAWLFEKISVDPRHWRVTTIIDGPILERAFAGWSMRLMDEKDLPRERRRLVIDSLDRAERGDGGGRNPAVEFAQCHAMLASGPRAAEQGAPQPMRGDAPRRSAVSPAL